VGDQRSEERGVQLVGARAVATERHELAREPAPGVDLHQEVLDPDARQVGLENASDLLDPSRLRARLSPGTPLRAPGTARPLQYASRTTKTRPRALATARRDR